MAFNWKSFCKCAICAGILAIPIVYKWNESFHPDRPPAGVEARGAVFTANGSGSVSTYLPDTIIGGRTYEVTQPQPAYIAEVTSLSM